MSKSGTSAATRTGCCDASNARIGPTPLLPLTHAFQKGPLPTPLGATTPSPVITTLRIGFAPRGPDGPFVSPTTPHPAGPTCPNRTGHPRRAGSASHAPPYRPPRFHPYPSRPIFRILLLSSNR